MPIKRGKTGSVLAIAGGDSTALIKKSQQKNAKMHINLPDELSAPVKKGDVFYIPAGTIHAIGKGILIAEVQQNCNLTYRVFDYGRKDADGKERELHIEDAIEAANLTPGVWENPYPTWRFPWGEKQTLSYCQYFVTNCITVYSERKFEVKPSSFTHILVTDGIGLLFTESGDYSIKKGDSVLLPAGIGTCRINGSLRYIETYLPSDDE